MATQDDVRRNALALPDSVEAKDRFAFSVRNKGKDEGFVWVWLERLDPKKARVRLAAIRARELEELITDAWRTMAPKALVKQFDEEQGS